MCLPLPNKLFSISQCFSVSISVSACISLSYPLSLIILILRHLQDQGTTLSCNVLHTQTDFHRPMIAATCNSQINGCRALINMSKGFSSMGVTYSCGALRPVIEAMVEHKVIDKNFSPPVLGFCAAAEIRFAISGR